MSDETAPGVTIVLQEGMRFVATGQDGIAVALDSSPEHGGTASGFRPLELLLVGLGGCTAMDTIAILRKKRQVVTGYRVEVSGVQATEHPRVYTAITIRHTFLGNDLSETAVRRAIELSETKYCSAYAMLEKTATITSTYEILPAAPVD